MPNYYNIETEIKKNTNLGQYDYNFKLDVFNFLQKRTFVKDENILSQNVFDECLIIILRGECNYSRNGSNSVRTSGTMIDALSSVDSKNHQLIVISKETCIIRLLKSDYNKIIDELEYRKTSVRFKALMSSKLFQDVPLQHIRQIDELCKERSYQAGILNSNTI